jgi:chromosome segregation ATPase
MDSNKLWFPILLLLLAVGGMFAYRHLAQVDEGNAKVLNARESLASVRVSLKARKESLGKVDAAAGRLGDAKARLAKSANDMEEAEKKQRQVESDLRYLTNSMPEAVEKVRAAGLGTRYPEVVLNDSKKLTDAQIKKFDESGISFLHSGGFQVVPVENLPPALVEQFDLGPNSLVRQIAALNEEFVGLGPDSLIKQNGPRKAK